jgi:hypothetical protein
MTRILMAAFGLVSAAGAAQAHVEPGHPTGATHPFAHLLDSPAGVIVLAALVAAAAFITGWLMRRR